ncbi:carbohydrate-binding protein [Metarhizium anisopliae]
MGEVVVPGKEDEDYIPQPTEKQQKILSTPDFGIGDAVDASPVSGFLSAYGYLESQDADTGKVGEKTVSALKDYQKFHKLKVDGKFGDKTRHLMAQPRCSFNDCSVAAEFPIRGAWQDRTIIYAFGTLSQQVDKTKCMQAIQSAMATWAKEIPGLKFVENEAHRHHEVMISFRKVPDTDCVETLEGGELAHASLPPAFGTKFPGMPKPVHFDETEVQWALGKQKGKYDVESVALHEIGHLLGMLHNGSQESIMYPRVSDNKLARKLSADDKTGIRRLYPEWKRVGGSFTNDPILVSWTSGNFTNLACVGGDGGLRHRYQREPYGTWHPAGEAFEHLGGKLAGNVAAVTRAEEHVAFFARGQDGKCYSKWYSGGWSQWVSRGGDVQGDIAAVSWGHAGTRTDLFMRGADNAIHHKYYDGAAWKPGVETWTSLGGNTTGSPKAVCWGPDRIDVFARSAADKSVLWKAWDGTKWVPEGADWTSLGGTALEDVAAVSSGVGHLYLFIRGADNTVYSKSYRDGKWEPSITEWGHHEEDLASQISSPISALAYNDYWDNFMYKRIMLVALSSSNLVRLKMYDGRQWRKWFYLGDKVMAGAPVLHPQRDNTPVVVARGTDGALWKWE